MAMFGKKAVSVDRSALSGSDRAAIIGAMLRDLGSSLNGGEADALMQTRSLLAQRQAMAQEADWRRQFGGLFGAQAGAMPPPVMNEQGEDISAAFGAAGAPSAAPGRVPTVRDALPLLMSAPDGVDVSEYAGLVKAAQPPEDEWTPLNTERGIFDYNKRTGELREKRAFEPKLEPVTVDRVIGGILAKMAAGETLSNAERAIYNRWHNGTPEKGGGGASLPPPPRGWTAVR